MSGKVRFSITAGEDLIKEYDEMSNDIGISRSALILIAMKSYLDQQKAIKFAPSFIDVAKQLDELHRNNLTKDKE